MFNSFKVKKPQRSTFSLSHKHETTVNIGDINCLHWNWCFPGDRFKIKYSFLCKFAPMIAPNFSRMRLKSEVFYVPLADLYDHFHDTIMNYKEESSESRENGNVTTVSYTSMPSMPIDRFALHFENLPSSGTTIGSDFYENLKQHTELQDFAIERLIHQIGVPFDICRKKWDGVSSNPYCANVSYLDYEMTGVGTSDIRFNPQGNVRVSLFPFMAYQYVYNWYYRDSVRSPEIDTYPDLSKAVQSVGRLIDSELSTVTLQAQNYVASSTIAATNYFFNSLFQVRRRFYRKDYFNTAVGDPTVGVDSISVPDNIVDLRKANQLQKFIEKQALAGNRIAEFIMAHWSHKSDDYELGRPILISSSSQNVQISEVLQTSQTTDDSAQGSRSGLANSYGSSNGSYFVAPDYGILLINMSIVPEISYFSGIPRKLTPYRWEHFPWPEFAQIGMQPIYDFELSNPYHAYAYETWPRDPLLLEDQNVFGYAPRYSEYKMELDQISGEMATSLRYWHQSPKFDFKQNLNQSFGLIGMLDYNMSLAYAQDQYYNQIFAVTSDYYADHCQVIGMFDISVNRALPYNDMPAL